MNTKRIMIVAGEASGDIYGADLAREACRMESGLRFFGIGGARMREAGVETCIDIADMAVVGFVEVLKHFDIISSAYFRLKKILLETPPDLLILIDYPGFNLRLAKVAKRAGVKVLYYISPQIWAWRQGRVKKIARLVDHMAVILPFEAQLYRQTGVPVTFVGHPMLDLVRVSMNRDQAAESFGLDSSRKIVGLFPGSRQSEIARMLPTIAAAARNLKERLPEAQFVVPVASTLRREDLEPHLDAAGVAVTYTEDRIHELIRSCDAIVSVSGTVTLEIALVGTPMVIIYRLAPLTYQLAKRLIKIKYIGLCNILAGRSVAEELIQDKATPDAIANSLFAILTEPDTAALRRSELSIIRGCLEKGGASVNVARLALEMIA